MRTKSVPRASQPQKRKTKGLFIKRKVVFKTQAQPESKVYLSGSFNDWNPVAKELKYNEKTGFFSCIVYLIPGRYEYKFVIDGIWCLDNLNPEFVPNGINAMNSVIHVE